MMIQGKVWGYTCPLFFKNNVELHFIKIQKGGYCSKHLHKYKYNQFIVFDGKLKVTVWKDYCLEDVTIVGKDQICTVAPGEFHKFEALEETTALEVYWVELSQNDIIREDHGGLEEDEKTTSLCCERQTDRKAIFISDERPNAFSANTEHGLYERKHFGNDQRETD